MKIRCLLGFHNYINIGEVLIVKEITPYGLVDCAISDRMCVDCGKLDDKATKIRNELNARLEKEQQEFMIIVRNSKI